MTTRSIFWKILVSFLLVVVTLIGGIGSYFVFTMRGQYQSMAEDHLLVQARVIATQATPLIREEKWAEVNELCRQLAAMGVARTTIILPDGRVAGDSAEDYRKMDNHADRDEVRNALAGRTWSTSVRFSDTLRMEMIYLAMPLIEDGELAGVVRTALPLTLWRENLRAIQRRIVAAVIFTLLIALLLTFLLFHAVWRPLKTMKEIAEHFATGDLSWRAPLDSPEEISALADSMNWMAAQLDEKISTVNRQRYEQRAIISSMSEGIVALDPNNHILALNTAAAHILELDVTNAEGRSLEEVTAHQALFDVINRIRQKQNLAEADIEIKTEGTTKFLQVRATLLCTPGQRMIGILLVLNDVSRLRRLENVRRDFVANVSHELKTPITTIKGFIETLQDNTCDAATTDRYLGIVAAQTDRLNSIIEDLLSLSRAEGDLEQGGIVREDTSVNEVVDGAIAICRAESDRKGIAIETACPVGLRLRMNSDLMEQALLNLINNAVKYSDEHTRIRVRVDADEQAVRFTVSDEGMGIAAEHLPRIFERFYRVDKNRSRKLGGTGLGLAIVKHIALAHQGRVDVVSEPGQGSTFTITIPRSS